MTAPYRRASRMVDAVTSNSQFVLERHLEPGYFTDIPGRVIFNIADTTNLAANAGPASDDLIFGFIGRLEPEKGIDVVLKAAELLPDTGWQLKIAGRGLEAYVRDIKAASRNDRVQWLGFAKSADFYAGVDVCLISSVWPEPLPRTLIEGDRGRQGHNLFHSGWNTGDLGVFQSCRKIRAARPPPARRTDAGGYSPDGSMEEDVTGPTGFCGEIHPRDDYATIPGDVHRQAWDLFTRITGEKPASTCHNGY